MPSDTRASRGGASVEQKAALAECTEDVSLCRLAHPVSIAGLPRVCRARGTSMLATLEICVP